MNELGKAGISIGSDGIPVIFKLSQSSEDQNSVNDNDEEDMKDSSTCLVAPEFDEIRVEVSIKNESFEHDKYEDDICFQPRATAVAFENDSSGSTTSIPNPNPIPDDCTQSHNPRNSSTNSINNINDILCDTESSLRNVLVQGSIAENLLFGTGIKNRYTNEHNNNVPNVQTDAEILTAHNIGTEKSFNILKNVLSTNGTPGNADGNVLQHITIDAAVIDMPGNQLEEPVHILKFDQNNGLVVKRFVERNDSNTYEIIHQQHDRDIKNNSDNCDQHVTKCHRINSFNELHGSVTAFSCDMSTSSDASDNCAVVSLSDDDDHSNNQSSDRDDENSTPCHDDPPFIFSIKPVDVATAKPRSQSLINLAIEIDDFPLPL